MHWLTKIDKESDEELLRQGEAYRSRANPLLAALSAIWLVILLAPELFDLSSTAETATNVVDGLMWAVFVVDLGIRIALAPNERVKWGLLAQLLVVLSMPVAVYTVNDRLSFVLRALFFVLVTLRAVGTGRFFLRQRSILFVILAEGVIIVTAGLLITAVERRAPGSTIHSLRAGLWWAVVTVATVGYGDTYPVTGEGRLVGVGLIVFGVAMFSILTANLAKLFVRQDEAAIARHIQGIHDKLDALQLAERSQVAMPRHLSQCVRGAGDRSGGQARKRSPSANSCSPSAEG